MIAGTGCTTLPPRLALALSATLLLDADSSRAQSVGPSIANSSYFHHVIGSIQARATERERWDDASVADEPDGFWAERIVSLTYDYENGSARRGRADGSSHFVAPALHWKTASGLSLELSAGYARSETDDSFVEPAEASDSFLLRIAPAQELLALVARETPDFTLLTAGLVIDYGYTSTEARVSGRVSESDRNALGLAPNLVLTRLLGSRSAVSGAAIYAYGTARDGGDRDGPGGGSDGGVVSVLGRIDGYFPSVAAAAEGLALHAWLAAQWNHQAHSSSDGDGDDWAEFSAWITSPIRPEWRVRLGYAIETFHAHSSAHHVMLQIEHNP